MEGVVDIKEEATVTNGDLCPLENNNTSIIESPNSEKLHEITIEKTDQEITDKETNGYSIEKEERAYKNNVILSDEKAFSQNDSNASSAKDCSQNEPSKTVGKKGIKKKKLEIDLKYESDEEILFNEDGSIRRYKKRERKTVVKYEDVEEPKERKKIPTMKEKLKRITYNEDDEQFICKTCQLPFMTLAAMISHEKKHFKETLFTCALCKDTFQSNEDLVKHKVIHKGEDFLCMKCEIAFTDHFDYLKHKFTHQKSQLYQCLECGKSFNRSYYIRHIEMHYDRMDECDICHKMIKSYQMIHHKSRMHVVKENNHDCPECDRSFKTKKCLGYHMISHTGVKPHQCLYCGRGFSNTQQRVLHTRTHTNERPYACKLCHQRFKQKGDMTSHLVSHSTEKKYECTVCQKKFLHKWSYDCHMDIHNNTQKYSCNLCNKKLHTKTGLHSHLTYAHSTEKRFRCEPCDKWFKTAGCLKRHCSQKVHINTLFGLQRKKEPA